MWIILFCKDFNFNLFFNLITLALFSYLQKNPLGSISCFIFQTVCCHFAICRPACPRQCLSFRNPHWPSVHRADPILWLFCPIHGFLLFFKWAVDEVSLIRLSQLTSVSAVCFPYTGLLTSPNTYSLSSFLHFSSCLPPFKKKIFWEQIRIESFINLSSRLI